jgi:hypothetical protein
MVSLAPIIYPQTRFSSPSAFPKSMCPKSYFLGSISSWHSNTPLQQSTCKMDSTILFKEDRDLARYLHAEGLIS